MKEKNTQNQIQSFCKKIGITEDQFYGTEKYTGSLDLRGLTSIPEGFNPTVGDYLYLRGLTKYIGAEVSIDEIEVDTPNAFFWGNYAMIDGIFCEVDQMRTTTIEGVSYEVRQARKVAQKDVFFIVSCSNKHAHGNEFKSAFEDLQFKIQSERLKKTPITEETLVTVDHYRAITGACSMGCKEFMSRHGIAYTEVDGRVKERNPIKAKDLLSILKKDNAYGVSRFEKMMRL